MTPIERAARALRTLENGVDDYDLLLKHRDQVIAGAVLNSLHDKVRAVLKAIKEPSEGMERAAINITGDMAVRKRDGTTYQHTEVFTAMLDAALSE